MSKPFSIPDQYNAAADLVDRNVAEGRGDKPAILCEERSLTYRDVQALANRVGNALRGSGVGMEQRVMLLLPDVPEFIAAFFGAVKIGAVPIPANTLLKAPDYEYMLNDSRARVLIAHHTLWPEVAKVRDRLRFLREVVLVGGDAQGARRFEAWAGAASPELEPAPTGKDDAVFLAYTSGTTGFPKGAVHLHHDMAFSGEHFARRTLGFTAEDRIYSAPKLFFTYGLGNSMYLPFYAGATVVLQPAWPKPDVVYETIQRTRPTVFFGVPTLYAALLAVPDADKTYDLSCLRLCHSGGEPLPPAIFEGWKARFGLEIYDGIGSTEAVHIFISNRPGDVRVGSSGRPVLGYEARVTDDQGRELPAGEIGNLMLKGDSVAACYWNKHEQSKRTFQGEWLFTGDKYSKDAEGYFWFAGRANDMLKVSGIWVSPAEVEAALIAHPAVLEAAVVGNPDEHGLIKPKAFVVLKPGHDGGGGLEAEMKAFVKERIAPYKYPRWITFVPELPKTATGKIQRFKLRQ
ncbi:MAG TPA: benzoate-CoA ligase family protein [Candidatus Sulfotelmatobacter sp.]|nr:benzoate-CoA ligase family protein [Candidatus Sulfotelmatobacter sp.]